MSPKISPELRTGLTARAEFTVTDDDTAVAVGSGSLPVLGTPTLLAWCEQVTCAVIDPVLEQDATSVGTRVSLEHLGASVVGSVVEVVATTSYVDGRQVRFTVAARQDGKLVGNGEVTRVVVAGDRFMARLS